jgi:hypothetical protein
MACRENPSLISNFRSYREFPGYVWRHRRVAVPGSTPWSPSSGNRALSGCRLGSKGDVRSKSQNPSSFLLAIFVHSFIIALSKLSCWETLSSFWVPNFLRYSGHSDHHRIAPESIGEFSASLFKWPQLVTTFKRHPTINGHFRNLNWRYLPYIFGPM